MNLSNVNWFSFFLKLVDHRVEFSKWWTTEFKTIKFPSNGTVFEYFIEPSSKKFASWVEMIPKFELDPEMPLQVVYQLMYAIINLNSFGNLIFPS